jgi:hypothetical protein
MGILHSVDRSNDIVQQLFRDYFRVCFGQRGQCRCGQSKVEPLSTAHDFRAPPGVHAARRVRNISGDRVEIRAVCSLPVVFAQKYLPTRVSCLKVIR